MRYCIAIAIFLGMLISCRQDLDLTTDYEETTIVYGLLGAQDSVHYVRVQRGFIDSAANALEIARNPDSLYYGPWLEVALYHKEEDRWHQLDRINGNEAGLPKEDGNFASDPNILYRVETPLQKGHLYELQVHNPETGRTVEASTTLLGDFEIQVPSENYVINWTGHVDEKAGFGWKHAPGAGLYDMQMRFWYTNFYRNGEEEQEMISWKVFTNKLILDRKEESLIGHAYRTALFYRNIANRIPQDTNVVYRAADSVTFIMAGGGVELAKLISNQRVRDGLLSGMATPYYTNIEGGYGIFSSIYRDTISAEIGTTTYDSLSYGRETRHLRF